MPEPQYRENLPEGCPLKESQVVQDPMIMYRCVHNPPIENDFDSYVALGLATGTEPRDICLDHAVSLFGSREKIANVQKKLRLPLARITLQKGSGRICQDGKPRRKHYSWWPYASCNVLECISDIEDFCSE
jgi:hypothetical protein